MAAWWESLTCEELSRLYDRYYNMPSGTWTVGTDGRFVQKHGERMWVLGRTVATGLTREAADAMVAAHNRELGIEVPV